MGGEGEKWRRGTSVEGRRGQERRGQEKRGEDSEGNKTKIKI